MTYTREQLRQSARKAYAQGRGARFPYQAPPLTERVSIRNPSDDPALNLSADQRDRFGQPLSPVDWTGIEIEVWAHRRDRAPVQTFEDVTLVQTQHTVWTVRARSNIEPDATIVHSSGEYRMTGPPVERGAPGSRDEGAGPLGRYLELYTERRT